MHDLLAGLEILSTGPIPLLLILAGVMIGFIVGVLPGFGSSQACALLLPFSATMASFDHALILMVSIYCGTYYAGAVPAILLNVPGEPGSAATALDGYPMTKAGKGSLAIGLARMASVLGGLLGGVFVLASMGIMSVVGLLFGSREMFLVAVLALIVASAVIGSNFAKGLVATLLGILIGAMSASTLTAQARFTLGLPELYEGVPIIPAIIGLMAMSEMFLLAGRRAIADQGSGRGAPNRTVETWSDIVAGIRTALAYPRVILQSSAIGTIFGLIPGVGPSVASFVSYGMARRGAEQPERFGAGAPEGIVASETADNASVTAALVPALTLGIPGSATTAIMLGALILHGIQPGPRLMVEHGAEAYAIVWAAIVASVLILPLGILMGDVLVRFSKVSVAFIIPIVLLLCTLGTLALRGSVFDVGLAFLFAILGIVMRQCGYPLVPLLLGLILGPIIESNLIRALAIGRGEISYLFASNLSVILWIMIVVTAVYSIAKERQLRKKHADAVSGDAV